MAKLTHNQVQNQLSEDHICQGCDLDTMDCVCWGEGLHLSNDLYDADNYYEAEENNRDH